MQGLPRRILYVGLYELVAVALATAGMHLATGAEVSRAAGASVVASGFAVAWNLLYNWGFELWEARQPQRGRSLGRRVAHALGFEAGFLVTLVPFFSWWLGVGLVEALVLEAGMIAFFLAYTFLYTLAFDAVFGLPASAR